MSAALAVDDPISHPAWLSRLPAGWQRRSVGSVCEVTLGKMLDSGDGAGKEKKPYLRAANVLWGRVDLSDVAEMFFTPTEMSRLTIRPGDVLVCEGGEVGRTAYVGEGLTDTYFQNSLLRVRPRDQMLSEFFAFAMAAAGSCGVLAGEKATIGHLTRDRLRKLRIPVPPLSAQQEIVRFLNEETSRIDAFLERKHKFIGLLDEKHAALRDRFFLCARGSQDAAVGRMKRVLGEVHERAGLRADLKLLTVSHLTGVTPRSEKNVTMFLAESFEDYKVCQPGDVVVNTMWAWAGAAGVSSVAGLVSPAYAVYRPRVGIDLDRAFLDQLLRSPGFTALMAAHSEGVWRSRLRLYPEVFLSLPVEFPSIEEQRQLVFEVERELEHDVPLGRQLSASMVKAREYRAALITAAVTGQVDFGEAA